MPKIDWSSILFLGRHPPSISISIYIVCFQVPTYNKQPYLRNSLSDSIYLHVLTIPSNKCKYRYMIFVYHNTFVSWFYLFDPYPISTISDNLSKAQNNEVWGFGDLRCGEAESFLILLSDCSSLPIFSSYQWSCGLIPATTSYALLLPAM